MKKKLSTLLLLVIVVLQAFGQTTGSVTDVSGNTYRTVQIGTQWWMAENLKADKLNDGTPIPYLRFPDDVWGNLSTPGHCWQKDSVEYRDIYGGIYNWYVVSTGKACPVGWHVPGESEWTQLANYLGGLSVAGGKMKEAGTAHWESPNTGATNESGFTGLPGGYRYWSFLPVNNIGWWWSADADADPMLAKYMGLNAYTAEMDLASNITKQYGLSIRCIEDIAVTGVTLNQVSLSLTQDSTSTLIATVFPSDATNKNVTWASSNPGVAWVSNLGVVTAVAPGTATITATTLDGNKTASCAVHITGMVTDVSGNTYRTVQIGTQWWMAENLKTDKFNDGTPIPNVSDGAAWKSLSTPGYCWLSDSVNYRNVYGWLYNWYTVKTGKVCPVGWHVPSENEWYQLANYLGGLSVAGRKMKEAGSAHWADTLWATNESGFTALPGGFRDRIAAQHWSILHEVGIWWSADVSYVDTTVASFIKLFFTSAEITFGADSKRCGFSVRCLEDIAVTGVTLNQASLSVTKSSISSLIATVSPSDATNKKVSWESNNPSVAFVTSSGDVIAIAAGSATITATTADGGKTATCVVTVTVPVTGVSISPKSLFLETGVLSTLKATVFPSDATNKTVNWSSSNPGIAYVFPSGAVFAIAAGSATITATTADGGRKASCTVTVPLTAYVDFGPNDGANGNITSSPDANGNYWNNVTNTSASSGAINLVDNNNLTTGVFIKITSGFSSNGIKNGGLLSPSASLLGDFAINTATQDYFFTESSSSFTVGGLDKTQSYVFYLFGTRNDPEKRITTYTLKGSNTYSGTLQTSGKDLGGAGYHGNTKKILTSNAVTPDANGQISVTVAKSAGTFGYLGAMKIKTIEGAAKASYNEVATEAYATDNATSVDAAKPDNAFLGLSPNPVQDRLFFNTSETTGITSVVIFNSLGNLVGSKQHLQETSLDVSHLPGGIYVIRFTINNKVYIKKFIKAGF